MEGTEIFKNLGKRFCITTSKKIPISPITRKPVKPNDATTWTDYESCLRNMTPGDYLGIFLGSVADGRRLGCIDLDHVRNESGEWSDLTLDTVAAAGSYSEVSMSGEGVHVFGYVTDDSIQSHKKAGIEIYTDKRFIAITGNQPFGKFNLADITAVVQNLFTEHFESEPEHFESEIIPVPSGADSDNWRAAEYIINAIYDKVSDYDSYFRILGSLASEFGSDGEKLALKLAQNPIYSDSEMKISRDFQAILRGQAGRQNVFTFGSLVWQARSLGVHLPIILRKIQNFNPSDTEWAGIIAENLRGGWLFNWDAKEWIYYDSDSGLWLADGTGKIFLEVQKITHRLKMQALETGGANTNMLLSMAKKLESAGKIKAGLELAAAELPVKYENFDADENILAFKNGCLNLKTMEFSGHAPENMASISINSEYNPSAKAEKWENFLSQIQPDSEIREFIQRLSGLFLLSGNPSQRVAFFHGQGGNGKSVFIDTWSKILGGLACKLPTTAIMSSKNGGGGDMAQRELFRARAARLAYVTETDAGDTINVSLVKDFSGEEKVTARKIYGSTIEYYPKFFPVIIGNNLPKVKTQDYGIWRRLLLVPFLVIIPESQRIDKEILTRQFLSESAGIINWALAGLADYRENGLRVPKAVSAATADYKTSSDILTEFIGDEIEFFQAGTDISISTADAYLAFQSWLNENGSESEWRGSIRSFNIEIKSRGYKLIPSFSHGQKIKIWSGARFQQKTEIESSIPEGDLF
jgi:putative DNA primase/helicase